MIDEKRIKEAENNVRNYLEEELLIKISIQRKEIYETFVRNFMESLKVAKILYNENHSDLWTIVVSYYAMYYAVNAVLYNLNYKVGQKIVHKVTADALIVFVRNKIKKVLLEEFEEQKQEALEIVGKKSDSLLNEYEKEMEKRSIIQYETTNHIKKSKAKTSLERAERFIFEMKKLLKM